MKTKEEGEISVIAFTSVVTLDDFIHRLKSSNPRFTVENRPRPKGDVFFLTSTCLLKTNLLVREYN